MDQGKGYANSAHASAWLSVTGENLDLDVPSWDFLGGCTSITEYSLLERLGKGTYGIVHRARHFENATVVAIKQIIMDDEDRANGIPITALREISILRGLNHPNIINTLDIAVGEQWEDVYLIMEYVEQDLAKLIDETGHGATLSQGMIHVTVCPVVRGTNRNDAQAKCLFKQLLEGLEYLHRNDIIHRDVKSENLLLTSYGTLKLADFGASRPLPPSRRPMTPFVTTIWYRSPEVLLGATRYSTSLDLWSAACVLAELLLSCPLLPGDTNVDQLSRVVKLLGSPAQDNLTALANLGTPDLKKWLREDAAKGRPENLARRFHHVRGDHGETVSFMKGLLKWDPRERWTAEEALGHGKSDWVREAKSWWESRPKACRKEDLVRGILRNERGAVDELEQEEKSTGFNADKQTAEKMDEGQNQYLFDFEDELFALRSAKRSRVK